jgi:hypothetical protein
MSRSSAANQILKELYEDIQDERMTRCWASPRVSTLTGVQLMDGLGNSVSTMTWELNVE